MVYAIFILISLCIIFLLYIIRMRLQLKSINHQLEERAKEESRQLLTLSLQNRDLIQLTCNVNRCLLAEEASIGKARRSEKDFKQLIANISHDLRTPLTAIKGYLQLLERDTLTEVEVANLKVALRYTEELGQLIDHFFEYTYLTDATPDMKLEAFDLTNLVIQVLADSVPLFEERGIEVQVTDAPIVTAYADKEMTTRIVQNLVRNCIAHADGNVTVAVEEGTNARIRFSNPVPASFNVDVNQVFDRFYTGDQSRHRTTGLGLSIVALLAERMGGKAMARVEDGRFEIEVELQKKRKK